MLWLHSAAAEFVGTTPYPCSTPVLRMDVAMRRFRMWLTLGVFLSSIPLRAAEPDHIQGNWLGTWSGKDGMEGKNVAEICGLGNGEYQATFTAYDGSELEKGVFTFAIRGSTVSEGKVAFTQRIDLGLLGMFSFDAEVENGKLLGKYTNGKEYEGTLELRRIVKRPDAVGAKPLPGAVTLLTGNELGQWFSLGERPAEWKLTEGVLAAPTIDRPKGGHLATKANFGDVQIHLEFRTPYLPEKREEERGRGGVFLWGLYELQILDSFGFPRPTEGANEFVDVESLGAVFGQKAASDTAALPPGEWQAFDITATVARFDADGKMTRSAEVTVFLNGTLIHDRVPLRKPTEDAPLQDSDIESGLVLQNAGQPVEYRNLWYVPLDGPAK